MAKKIRDPFHTSANPTCLLMTPEVEAVIGRAKFAVESRQGLTAILGDVGLGKTSLVRYLWMHYKSEEGTHVAMIPTPAFPSEYGLLKAICDEFKLPGKRSAREQMKELLAFGADCNADDDLVIIIIDEANQLNAAHLELLRGLLNFEKPDEKLFQIVLAGQLELRDRLVKREYRAIYQRIYAPSMLNAMTLKDTRAMIDYRCRHSDIENPFGAEAVGRIHELTGGVPRMVLALCGQSYEVMLRLRRKRIEVRLIEEVHAQGNLEGVKLDAAA